MGRQTDRFRHGRGAKGLRGRWNSGGHKKFTIVSAASAWGGHPSQALLSSVCWSWVLPCFKAVPRSMEHTRPGAA